MGTNETSADGHFITSLNDSLCVGISLLNTSCWSVSKCNGGQFFKGSKSIKYALFIKLHLQVHE